jgi:hypothetical protein
MESARDVFLDAAELNRISEVRTSYGEAGCIFFGCSRNALNSDIYFPIGNVNPSRRYALMLSVAVHLLALYALVRWASTVHSPKADRMRFLTIQLMPQVPQASIASQVTDTAQKSALQNMTRNAPSPPKKEVAQATLGKPVGETPVPSVTAQPATSTPTSISEAKPLSTDPGALVKSYNFEDSKSDLQRAIEAHGGTMHAHEKGKYETFHEEAEFASIPNCMGPDALKHDPAKIGPVGLGGLLALPFLAHAAITGKCK